MKIFLFRLKTIPVDINLLKVSNRKLEKILTHVDLFEKAIVENVLKTGIETQQNMYINRKG